MLAAENPPVDSGHLASTPRRRGMDCKPSNNSNKKLVQARLPFKRLNPEPKENPSPKRPCAHACPGVELLERENESSPVRLHNGPPLVNGRGPLDGFLSRRRPVSTNENVVIDLTEENVSPVKPILSSKDKQQKKDRRVSSGKLKSIINSPKTQTVDSIIVDDDGDVTPEVEQKDQTSTSVLDTTQESECEAETQNKSQNVSSLGNGSLLSLSPDSSMSESSPEKSKTEDPTPTTTPAEPNTTPKIPGEKKAKRRSLKGLQEQEEKLRLRQEKERLKDEAKAAKEKKKEDARRLKEEREREKREKKERDERDRKEKKEKEEKEKADRLKAKEEQRKSKLEAKLEEKRKKEEEKRIKEEEKRLKEEKDRVKAEKAEITRFLQKPVKSQLAPKTLSAACGKFAPFEIKENMFLAPLTRVQFEDSDLEKLDEYLFKPVQNLSGLKDWFKQKPRSSGPTKTRTTDSLSDCNAVESPNSDGAPDRSRHGPMKLLQFHENYRPAYWGTWSKKSSHISARCPLRQDKDLLDYEVDSDEEWEEEEPGESLSHSEGEDEGGEEDDEDDDDGFFVPHGYLSEDEGALEEEDGGDLEKQKLQQKLKAKEWDELMSSKKKMKLLEPVVRGCVWEGESQASELFHVYALSLIEPLAKTDTSPSPEEQRLKSQQETQLLGQLLPLLHGNVNSSKTIITEYQEFCRQQSSPSSPPTLSSPQNATNNIPSRLKLRRLIKNSAVYEKRSVYKRCCWYVHSEVLSQFGQEALPVPCQWTYLTTGAREEAREEPQAATGSVGNSPTTPQTSAAHKRRSAGSMSITKFMKKCNEAEPQEAMEADGFQADTEEDEEEECVIVSTTKGAGLTRGNSTEDQPMEVTSSVSVSDSASVLASV